MRVEEIEVVIVIVHVVSSVIKILNHHSYIGYSE